MERIVVACDSFKGCLSSGEIASCIREEMLRLDPGCEVRTILAADGGEGTVDAVCASSQGRWCKVRMCAHGPDGRETDCEYAVSAGEALMECAQASGLCLVDTDRRNPLLLDSRGTGEMVLDAISGGCRKITVGLGGSATVDGGTGMLRALGFRFLDRESRIVEGVGKELTRICSIDDSGVDKAIFSTAFTVACDVRNPLCGPQGAARVFGPQKGATPEMVGILDTGLMGLARAFNEYALAHGRPADAGSLPGGGAAGGLGAAFQAVLGADMVSGTDMVLTAADLDSALDGANLCITGEGHMDSQTLEGKTPYGVMLRAKRKSVLTAAICGRADDEKMLLEAGFDGIFQVSDPALPLEVQMDPSRTRVGICLSIRKILALAKDWR